MLKTLFAAAGILLASLGVAQASTLEQIKNATYELYADGAAICSGEFVSPTEFLTANHCVETGVKQFYISVEKDGGRVPFYLTIKNRSDAYDTATFTVDDRNAAFPFVDVAAQYVPKAGDHLVSVSYPGNFGYQAETEGLMTGLIKGPDSLPGILHYQTSLLISPGSSGGGLYTLIGGDYKLIGTLTGMVSVVPWLSFWSISEGVNQVI